MAGDFIEDGRANLEQNPGWRTNVCVICGTVVGAGLGLWWRDYNGAVFVGVLGTLVGYAIGKPDWDRWRIRHAKTPRPAISIGSRR
jgi:hypothetical protein